MKTLAETDMNGGRSTTSTHRRVGVVMLAAALLGVVAVLDGYCTDMHGWKKRTTGDGAVPSSDPQPKSAEQQPEPRPALTPAPEPGPSRPTEASRKDVPLSAWSRLMRVVRRYFLDSFPAKDGPEGSRHSGNGEREGSRDRGERKGKADDAGAGGLAQGGLKGNERILQDLLAAERRVVTAFYLASAPPAGRGRRAATKSSRPGSGWRPQVPAVPATTFVPQTQAFTLIDRSDDLIERAANKLKLGDASAALAAADRAIAANPNRADARVIKAKALIEREDFLTAEIVAGGAVLLDAEDPEGHRALGQARLMLGKVESAHESLSEAIRLNPQDAQSFEARSFVYERLGERERMRADHRKAAELMQARETSVASQDKTKQSGLSAHAKLLILALVACALAGAWIFLRRCRSAPPSTSSEAASPAAAITRISDPDDVIAQKYRRVRVLSESGGQSVWMVRHRKTQQSFVVKPFRADLAPLSREEKRTLRKRMGRVYELEHPGIVRIHDLLENQVPPMVIQEYMTADTLDQFLKKNGALDAVGARPLMTTVCEALSYAHGCNVLHLNLKPSNIFMDPAAGTRIADFRLLGDSPRPTGLDAALYAAPELARGLESPRSDVYSLGMCLHDMLQDGPALTPQAEAFIRKAVHAEPDMRHATVGEFLAALQNVLL